MSEPPDGAWMTAMARARGVELDPARAAQVAQAVAPVLSGFASLASELYADDDPQELRRLLEAEAVRA